ncbi:hypothetical protein L1987_11138 [Smallanthus sonchifolius]|uniref:Uncharacterized protein n=1 Tax=Smallanthus sonchifolius TaxID=185202 RepID=A0ACB9JBM9_9ASTR|nr:hypothetical protein L1987_11138 [Smallanthus sonchifolius]
MSSSTQTTLNRQQLYRLTNGILNAHCLHFIPISLLFFPLTFAAVKLYSFSSSGTDATTEIIPFNILLIKTITASSQNLLTVKTLTTALTFSFFVILPTVAGIALITYSTHQAIHHKQLTFSSTLKSLSHSYIPLLHTLTAGSITLIILFLTFTLSSIAVTESVKALGFHFDPFFFSTLINSIVSYALAITILFFIVIWGSASAITVLESKSGFETLRQSANQSTEFRTHSFSIVFITGFAIGMSLSYASVCQNSGPVSNWIWILQAGVIYLDPLLMILMSVVANTVLYVQCKAASGEEVSKTTVDGEVFNECVVVNGDEDYEKHILQLSIKLFPTLEP